MKAPAVAKPPLYPKLAVEDMIISGADGWALRRGHVVRKRPCYSESLRVEVPGDLGRIVDIYRRTEGGPVLIDVRRDLESGCGGLATWLASMARRSSAQVGD